MRATRTIARRLAGVAAAVLLIGGACGGSEPTAPTRGAGSGTRGSGRGRKGPAAGGAAAAQPGQAAGAPALPQPNLQDSDFVANLQNRDPFRSFLREFIAESNVKAKKSGHPIIAPKYALEDLHLIAIATGGTAPRAMFRDPTGYGVVVGRGEYLSKVDARVVRILSNAVVVELDQPTLDGAPHVVTREITLYPEEEPAAIE